MITSIPAITEIMMIGGAVAASIPQIVVLIGNSSLKFNQLSTVFYKLFLLQFLQ